MNPFYRVDNRLVHGQIISTWVPHLRLQRMVVLGDSVPDNELQCAMFRMAMPQQTTFDTMTVEAGARWLNEKGYGDARTMVLMESIHDAVRLFEAGHAFPTLNIGNVHHGPGSRAITNAVYLDQKQLEGLRRLARRGVEIEVRSLPMETAVPFAEAEAR